MGSGRRLGLQPVARIRALGEAAGTKAIEHMALKGELAQSGGEAISETASDTANRVPVKRGRYIEFNMDVGLGWL